MRALPPPLIPPSARAYWVERPGKGSLRQEALSLPAPEGYSLIETWVSGISPGTERLVGLGNVPPECWGVMDCPFMAGSFELPVKYGYCLVGRALNGAYLDQWVFTMHPHQDYAIVPENRLLPLPEYLPPLRATLIPNLETALNAIWDSEYQPPEPVAIVGGGIVGVLIAFLLKTAWGHPPVIIELDKQRRQQLKSLPWEFPVMAPDASPREAFSLCFHTSGQGSGLQTALDSVGFEGRIVEASWFGDRPVSLHLGGGFHFQRKQILSSQVSTIAKPKREHLTHRQRLEQVLEHLQDPWLDGLISSPIAFDNLPLFMQQLYHKNPDGFSFAIIYPPFHQDVHKP